MFWNFRPHRDSLADSDPKGQVDDDTLGSVAVVGVRTSRPEHYFPVMVDGIWHSYLCSCGMLKLCEKVKTDCLEAMDAIWWGLSLSSRVIAQSVAPAEDRIGGVVAQTPSLRTAMCDSGKQPGDSQIGFRTQLQPGDHWKRILPISTSRSLSVQ